MLGSVNSLPLSDLSLWVKKAFPVVVQDYGIAHPMTLELCHALHNESLSFKIMLSSVFWCI